MRQYKEIMRTVLDGGADRPDRTGTGTLSVFGAQMRFSMSEGFPLVTGKFTPFKLVATELLWFLKGNPDISYLHENGCHIWDEWVKADGTFGPIYGQQWRSWYNPYRKDEPIDQIKNVIDRLKSYPDSRRLLVSAWNVADVELGEMALPPCHVLFQFYSRPMSVNERLDWTFANQRGFEHKDELRNCRFEVAEAIMDRLNIPRRELSCQLYQRSADLFLGVPFNIASYSLLLHMVAHVTNHAAGDFVWTGGDVHLYRNHMEQALEYCDGRRRWPLPKLWLNPEVSDIDSFTLGDMKIYGYKHEGKLSAPVAV